ncbi:MAG: DEAD/DEAH box helicase family protein [Acidobacteria bacterium]|nr:DEAD/DEAH box helicase family protein [Acidobacteriota bacterium]
MIDFKKRLTKRDTSKPIDPVALYDTLDRASDKGPLRPAQMAVLKEWHESHRNNHDVVLKLHTGQGKTLIGLLMLQAKLNENEGPVVYLCPNNFLVNQTSLQATQFGVPFCVSEGGDLPFDFLDGKSIFITSIHKLFNGLTKFGIGAQSISVNTLLMDDAHACIDAVRTALSIHLSFDEAAYTEIRDLFATALQNQGTGTYADICDHDQEALLLIPYWEWRDKHNEVVEILAKYGESKSIKFAWPLLKDMLAECQCVISGKALEIAPYLPPLDLFGSYHKAKCRIFMSATVTDDSFLIKGLGLLPKTIQNPLVYKEETWSGEKMILIPALIDSSLDRGTVVATFATPKRRAFGTVALVPGFKWTKDWEAYGSTVASKETINTEIDKLIKGDFSKTLVVVNRYDGIDLPDSTCRVLIMDSKPHSESLIDRYSENCRATSDVTAVRTARTIEQGLGRSVRGEKDYCVIIFTGTDLIKIIRARESRKYLSNQTNTQIDIGFEIAEMLRDEKGSVDPTSALISIINQCLRRDEGWKEFYVERMGSVTPSLPGGVTLELFSRELEAEKKYHDGDIDGAVKTLQSLVDEKITDEFDKGWYLQEMARYKYPQSKEESNKLQVSAHRRNRFLLKPRSGMQFIKIEVVSQKRMENIISWVTEFEDYKDLSITLEDILSAITFGVKADRFEEGFNNLAKILGFEGQRPDKEWKEGPDNLWGLRDNEYLLVECKSEVQLKRSDINKSETEQMNRSCAWFSRYYPGAKVKNVMIIPSNKLAIGAALTHEVSVLQPKSLDKLKENVRRFFAEFESLDLKNLSEKTVQDLINTHQLSVEAITTDYFKSIKSWK